MGLAVLSLSGRIEHCSSFFHPRDSISSPYLGVSSNPRSSVSIQNYAAKFRGGDVGEDRKGDQRGAGKPNQDELQSTYKCLKQMYRAHIRPLEVIFLACDQMPHTFAHSDEQHAGAGIDTEWAVFYE